MRYITKPKYIEAVKYDGTNRIEVQKYLSKIGFYETLEKDKSLLIICGGQRVELPIGHYLFRDRRGKFQTLGYYAFEDVWEEVRGGC